MIKDLAYRTFAVAGGPRWMWRADGADWRVLNYHGICADDCAQQSWLPPFFVSEAAFRDQLAYLQREANVISVTDALQRLDSGTLPARAVSLTFDDGYGNNLYRAVPILQEFQMPATLYVSTFYVESGEFYIFDRLALLREHLGDNGAAVAGIRPYHSNPIDEVFASSEAPWRALKVALSAQQIETLRPLTVTELQKLASNPLISIGGHTHTHCIFSNETAERRRSEAKECLSRLKDWVGRDVDLFSYPNGEAHNFSMGDETMLRDLGVRSSFSMIRGNNDAQTDRYALRRYGVSIHHDRAAFIAEICGLRDSVRRLFVAPKD